jgi:hypothetical protein
VIWREQLAKPKQILKGSPLGGLPALRDCSTRRAASWDRTGGNADFWRIEPCQQVSLLDTAGAGTINHIWITTGCIEPHYLRRVVLRMYWDGEEAPSVEVPLGDFFGVGHARTVNFSSLPLNMSPEDGRSFNCFFPMPFGSGARVLLANECERHPVTLYFHLDYERYERLPEGLGRFHAQWRRENPCVGISDAGISNDEFIDGGSNLTGEGNYVILKAEGTGHYVGCNLNVHNLRVTEEENWYGSGDDMIFVDDEAFPPSLHGTGTEDYFGAAYCPTQSYCTPYHGMPLPGGPNWSGQISMYRFHIEDPICFRKSILVTIEHGHANRRSDDLSSTAYWYQAEPHARFPVLPDVAARLPRAEI